MADHLSITELQPGEEATWDDFVQQTPQSGFMQLAGWKHVLERSYGHRTRYLIARENECVRGVLPLFVLQNRLFGTRVTSPPGAICTDDQRAGQELLQAAIDFADELDADELCLTACRRVWDGNLVTVQRHCTHILELPLDAEALWKSISRHKRKNVNKAEREGLKIEMCGRDQIDFLHEVLAYSLRLLGTPVFGKELLRSIFDEFPEQTHILVAKQENRLIGAMLIFAGRSSIHAQWSAAYHEYRDIRPNDSLYWKMLSWGCEHGIPEVDMGRSQWGSGNFNFKVQWGARTQPLYYQYYLRRGASIPDLDLKMDRVPFYRLATWGWRHLPLSVTLRLGPYLRKNLYPL